MRKIILTLIFCSILVSCNQETNYSSNSTIADSQTNASSTTTTTIRIYKDCNKQSYSDYLTYFSENFNNLKYWQEQIYPDVYSSGENILYISNNLDYYLTLVESLDVPFDTTSYISATKNYLFVNDDYLANTSDYILSSEKMINLISLKDQYEISYKAFLSEYREQCYYPYSSLDWDNTNNWDTKGGVN